MPLLEAFKLSIFSIIRLKNHSKGLVEVRDILGSSCLTLETEYIDLQAMEDQSSEEDFLVDSEFPCSEVDQFQEEGKLIDSR